MDNSPGRLAAVFDVPRDPRCAARARRFVRAELGPGCDDDALERVLLIVSELVTNAWKHGTGKIEMRFARVGGKARVEVIDEGTGKMPEIRTEPLGRNGGWGLRIVDELAAGWGCHEGTTHVWADVVIG